MQQVASSFTILCVYYLQPGNDPPPLSDHEVGTKYDRLVKVVAEYCNCCTLANMSTELIIDVKLCHWCRLGTFGVHSWAFYGLISTGD